jgi:hypothetical protein
MNPEKLARAFEAGTLAPAEFGHAEHVCLAWHYLSRDPLLVAVRRMCDGLKRYTRAIGVAEKYHETLTLAWLMLVQERRAVGGGNGWAAFRRGNPDLFDAAARPLDEFYRPQTLGSPAARRHFVLPDRVPAGDRAARASVSRGTGHGAVGESQNRAPGAARG